MSLYSCVNLVQVLIIAKYISKRQHNPRYILACNCMCRSHSMEFQFVKLQMHRVSVHITSIHTQLSSSEHTTQASLQ